MLGIPGGSVVKNPPANAGDLGSIPGLGRSPGKEMARLSSILAWRSPWAEKPGGATVHKVTKELDNDLETEQQQYKHSYTSLEE